MSFTAETLFDLLPAIYRIRDAEIALRDGSPVGPLASLLAVIAEQVAVIEENLDQLYDDQFIETCADWVAPYIGDLIGYRTLHGVAPNVSSPRSDVADTIRFRRRKGTVPMLEQLAADVTGWPARAVEFFQLLAWTQYMNHVRPDVFYAPDLRRSQRLLWRDTALDTLAHTVDVRRVSTGAPRHNIRNIGLFLFRVRAFPLTRVPASAEPLDAAGRFYRFDPLGRDLPLYTRARTEEEITHLAEAIDLPMPIARRWMDAHLGDYYGPDKSVLLELSSGANADPSPIPTSSISVCNLADVLDGSGNVIGWAHPPKPGSGRVAVDPVLGRIAFADAPQGALLASFHYGFTSAIGGGEYERDEAEEAVLPLRRIRGGAPLQSQLDAAGDGGAVEIADSGRYDAAAIRVNAGKRLVLRAANGARPLLAPSGDIAIDVGAEGTLVIDGLLIAGAVLRMPAAADDAPRHLVLRHCTLAPGAKSSVGGGAQSDAPSLVVAHAFASVDIEDCILGPLHVVEGARVTVRNSIVDATSPEGIAYRGPSETLAPGAALTTENATIVGRVHAVELTRASNTLFVAEPTQAGEAFKAPVWAERRQSGCVRFSYVPPGSRAPHRFHCQPPEKGDPRIRPHFTSLQFGDAGYCQLQQSTPDAIRRGADDESEMGVLHDLFQPQREINLRIRLEEYLRFGLEAGIVFAD